MHVVKGPDNNSELIRQWINDYEKDLLRLCYIYLKDVFLAEDAVQETFLKAYRKLHLFQGESSPRTWLIRIAINVCKDVLRKAWFRHFRNTLPMDSMPNSYPEGDFEIKSALVAAIADLPKVNKEAVYLYHYEGFTQSEIADLLHVSIPTIHRRLETAYALLKKTLEGGSPDES